MGSIFSYYLNFLYPYKKLKGYRLYFRGKLGKKGSVKKSTIFFSGGKISYTNKSLKYNYKYFLIPTETGVVGCYISLFFKKMFTYIYIYLTLYILTYFFILTYLVSIKNIITIQNLYLTAILNILKKYTKLSPLLLFFFFLTGLPPVGFFFIKFNLLLNLFNNLNFVIYFFIFINILLTMFFYLQVFTISNKNLKQNISLFKNLRILNLNKFKHNNFKLNFYLSSVLYSFFNLFFIYFFTDLYLIYSNLSI